MPIRPRHIAPTLCLGFVGSLLPVPPASAGETLRGPVEARVLRVIDGDTFVAEARIWPGQTVTVNVRLRGIDAPEIRTRCAVEKAAGLRSRDALERLIGGATVEIRNITGGKYYGRVLADVTTSQGESVGARLLERSLARAYEGGRRRSACG
ncbi:thermonuclease family protein [Chelativorans sp. M5D2P16]|uniref:thermonuclease family protein n=1 Tax=Chelativorans sp. M5D2P16 TaxID=3095678 RepID=UPI002ACA5144|nr:thermonuclease family protein [Chelativorans sp. M5D2P16]MDZ5699301.1 thermonuclease family protein [Chelativorans sp. M5D2P16]